MGLDKSWMQITDRTQPSYEKGVIDFIEFAFTNLKEGKLIRCPCKKCNNNIFQSKRIIYEHLITIRIKRDYVIWDLHREVAKEYYEDDDKKNYSDEIQSMLRDIEIVLMLKTPKKARKQGIQQVQSII